MCGRYTLHDTSKSKLNLNREIVPDYNVCPGTKALVINDAGRTLLVNWMFRVPWAKNFKLINARSETLGQKKMFQDSKRCIFVANGYFEWKKQSQKKMPYYHVFNSKMMYFGGIMNNLGACIVTRKSYANVDFVHDRQPVILDYDDFEDWFRLKHNFDCEDTKNMDVFRVSIKVNNPRNNNIENILRIIV